MGMRLPTATRCATSPGQMRCVRSDVRQRVVPACTSRGEGARRCARFFSSIAGWGASGVWFASELGVNIPLRDWLILRGRMRALAKVTDLPVLLMMGADARRLDGSVHGKTDEPPNDG
jgi:hypothetical protein